MTFPVVLDLLEIAELGDLCVCHDDAPYRLAPSITHISKQPMRFIIHLPSAWSFGLSPAATSTRTSLSPIAKGNRSTSTRSRRVCGGDRL